jgi:hypothetical protein
MEKSKKTLSGAPVAVMNYRTALDIAAIVQRDDPQWQYTVEIFNGHGDAHIAVYNEEHQFMGYL